MENINIKLKEAFNLDAQKRFPEAYIAYITCMLEINKNLLNPEIPNQTLKKLFSLSKQCLERSETIRFSEHFTEKESFSIPKEQIIQPTTSFKKQNEDKYDPYEEKKKQLDFQNEKLKLKMSQNNDVWHFFFLIFFF
jgi:hypothetical protein